MIALNIFLAVMAAFFDSVQWVTGFRKIGIIIQGFVLLVS